MKPCKLCEKRRFANTSWCYLHFRARERAKREEKKRKKDERRKGTKKYQDKERKNLISKCDIVFSKIIRSAGECLWNDGAEHKGRLECSHIFSRRHMAIRWHELNCKPLCTAHHFTWHKHPAEAAIFLSTIRTPEEIKWLKEQTNTVKQWTTDELKTLLETLYAKLSTLQ